MQQLTLNVSTVYHVITNLELHTMLVWFSLIISCVCIMATNTTRTHAHSSPLNTLLLIPYNKLQNTRRPSQQQRPEKGGGHFGFILAGFYGDNSGCWLQRWVCYQQLYTIHLCTEQLRYLRFERAQIYQLYGTQIWIA